MLLGGAIGAFITYTVIQSVAALGPAKSIMLIVTSQLIAAYLIELFGLFGTQNISSFCCSIKTSTFLDSDVKTTK